jgi:hypothetical protein
MEKHANAALAINQQLKTINSSPTSFELILTDGVKLGSV